MAFQLPELPYAKDALAPHISAETLEFHWGKHHRAYVNKTNDEMKADVASKVAKLESADAALKADQDKIVADFKAQLALVKDSLEKQLAAATGELKATLAARLDEVNKTIAGNKAEVTAALKKQADDLVGAKRELELAQASMKDQLLAKVAADTTPDLSVAFLVCGSSATTAQLRHAGTMFRAGVEVVVVRCVAGESPGLRRVGEMSILTIGYLDDLRSSLARSRAA